MRIAIIMATTLLLLVACGQKGDLYMPDDSGQRDHATRGQR